MDPLFSKAMQALLDMAQATGHTPEEGAPLIPAPAGSFETSLREWHAAEEEDREAREAKAAAYLVQHEQPRNTAIQERAGYLAHIAELRAAAEAAGTFPAWREWAQALRHPNDPAWAPIQDRVFTRTAIYRAPPPAPAPTPNGD